MGDSAVLLQSLGLYDYEEGKEPFKAPCLITSVIYRSYDRDVAGYRKGQPVYFEPYAWWRNTEHVIYQYMPFSVGVVSGDTSARIIQRPWTEQPVYATHQTGTGQEIQYNAYSAKAIDITYYRQIGGQLWQMLPDIIVARVDEPTVIKVSIDIKGVYASSSVTVYPADIQPMPDMYVNGQLLGIYPNDRTETIFTGFKGVMKKNQEVI